MLDYIFFSSNIQFEIKNLAITQPVKNPDVVDHSALKLNFKTDCGEKGPDYWKINNSVLNEPQYIRVINNAIRNTINDCKSLNSKQLTWEMVKLNIKECKISYCTSNL